MTATPVRDATPAPTSSPREAAVPAEPVTLRRVITSQWLSFRTLRSSPIIYGVSVLGMLIIALLVAYNTRHLSANLDANDLVPSSPLQGYYLAQLLIGALGVLLVTGEFGTGQIRSTFIAVPKRLPVFWAKLVVFGTLVLPTMIVTSVVSFLAAEGLLSHFRPGYSLSSPGAARVAVGTGVYLAAVGVLGMAIGWLVRSTPGSLVTYVALIDVLPAILGNALGHTGKQIAEVLPSNAGGSFISNLPEQPALGPWFGLVVLLGWVVVAVGVAAATVNRRDA